MARGLRNKIIIIASVALVAALVVCLAVIGAGRKGSETEPSAQMQADSVSQTSSAEETDEETDGQPQGETQAQTQKETEAGTKTETKGAEQTVPRPDFIEGVEVWEDTNPATQPPVTTAPSHEADATSPSEETTMPPVTDEQKELTYEQYLKLSRSEQQAYFRSYDNVEDFYQWLDAAQAEYEKQHPNGTGDGSIDIGDYIP